nr:hypothetical protein [Tanacetum cinerariifolium]
FWNSVSVKRSGDVTRLQALVDKKKITISEAVIQEILQLNDAEGVVCLSNEEIFAGLAQMGYEKPSTKMTFYKAFFSRVETPLFEGMIAERQPAEEELEAEQMIWRMYSTRGGRKGVVIRDPEEELPSDTLAETSKVKDKGKGILIEAPKPMKKKEQIEIDAEYA